MGIASPAVISSDPHLSTDTDIGIMYRRKLHRMQRFFDLMGNGPEIAGHNEHRERQAIGNIHQTESNKRVQHLQVFQHQEGGNNTQNGGYHHACHIKADQRFAFAELEARSMGYGLWHKCKLSGVSCYSDYGDPCPFLIAVDNKIKVD